MLLKNFFYCLAIIILNDVKCDLDANFDDIDDLFESINNNEDYFDGNLILENDVSNIFEELTLEEKKSMLSKIFDKMDVNNDGSVNKIELKNWMRNVHTKMLVADVESFWEAFVSNNSETIDFKTYFESTFGTKMSSSYEKLIKSEKRKWVAADLNEDHLLNRSEFLRFLHPQEFEEMKPIVADELLGSMDKNNDTFLDINEYLAHVLLDMKSNNVKWIDAEKENFRSELDMNKDGFLDKDEIQKWQLSESNNRIDDNVQFVLKVADTDKNEMLSKSEILDNYFIFTKSKNNKGSLSNMTSKFVHEDL